jgi:hypothetical protein
MAAELGIFGTQGMLTAWYGTALQVQNAKAYVWRLYMGHECICFQVGRRVTRPMRLWKEKSEISATMRFVRVGIRRD